MAEKLQRSLIEVAQRQERLGKPVVRLVAGQLRAMLAGQETPDSTRVTIVATVGQN